MIFCRTARHGEAPFNFAEGGKVERNEPTGVGGTNLHQVLYEIVAKYIFAILTKFYFVTHIQ